MSIEAMKQALEALELTADRMQKQRDAITALRAAIAEASGQDVQQEMEPEPVAWMYDWTTSDGEFIQNWTTSEAETLRDTEPTIISNVRPLYTQPPRREWVGLTDEELEVIYAANGGTRTRRQIAAAIEAKLKEKNS